MAKPSPSPYLAAAVAIAAAALPAQSVGAWEPAFNHEVNTPNTNVLNIPPTYLWPATFNSIHMAMIPCGPYRGQVLVWDKAELALHPYQRWAMIDPAWTPGSGKLHFRNFFLNMPPAATTGDLFCAGLTWMRDGRLFVAGGTAIYPVPPNFYFGAALCYQFCPDLYDVSNGDFGLWKREADLGLVRWYPSLTYLADDSVLICGGSNNSAPNNNYEVYRVPTPGQDPPATAVYDQRPSGTNPRVYDGPTLNSSFADYPRTQMLTTGQPFVSGWFRRAFKWTHTPAAQPVYDFTAGAGPNTPSVSYASSLLDPRTGGTDNKILRIGGQSYGLSRYDVDYCTADTPGNWSSYGPPFRLRHPRWMQNAVILPTAEIFVFGGFSDGLNPGTPELTPELLTTAGWVDQPQETGGRGYHATAVLMPDGRVFCGGADLRTIDYQIYRPPYIVNGRPRPTGVGCDSKPMVGGMHYRDDDPGAIYTAWWDENLPANVSVTKVVLIRPGALTHHSDMSQRYLSLEIVRDDDVPPEARIRFRAPRNSRQAPRGWYMLFLLTNENVPSEAIWVHLQ